MIRVGVVDVGTNSTRLLVADVSEEGKLIHLFTDLKTTRLGEGFEGGVLLPGPVSRTVDAIQIMKSKALEYSVDVLVAAGTSAVRDAANSEYFREEVFRKTGLSLRVLDGQEEAFYSYRGVAAQWGNLDSAVIADIGGGSTEFTWQKGGKIICRSVNAGAVRMTEGGHGDREIFEIMRGVLEEVRGDGPEKLIGVGGTVTTLAAMDMALEVYDRSLVHGYRLTWGAVLRLRDLLLTAGPEGRKKLPGLQPARADIILAGVRILMLLMDYLGMKDIIVSEADLLQGLAIEAAKNVDKNIDNNNQ